MLVNFSVCAKPDLEIFESVVRSFECRFDQETSWEFKLLEFDEEYFESFEIVIGSDRRGPIAQIVETIRPGGGVALFFPGFLGQRVRYMMAIVGRTPANVTHLYVWIEDLKPVPYQLPMHLRYQAFRPLRAIAGALDLPALMSVVSERHWPTHRFELAQTRDELVADYGPEVATVLLLARDDRFSRIYGQPQVVDLDNWHHWFPSDL
jgi:hypothetical protein